MSWLSSVWADERVQKKHVAPTQDHIVARIAMLPPLAVASSITAAGLWAAVGGGAEKVLKTGLHPVAFFALRAGGEVALVMLAYGVLTLLGLRGWLARWTGLTGTTVVAPGLWKVLVWVMLLDIAAYLIYYSLLTAHAAHVIMALTMTSPLLLAAYRVLTGRPVSRYEWLGISLIVGGVVLMSVMHTHDPVA